MSTIYLRPTGDVTVVNIGITGAATVFDALNDPIGANDADTTRIARSGTTVNGLYICTKEILPAVASISVVRMHVIARQTHVGSVTADILPFLNDPVTSIRYFATTIVPIVGAAYDAYVFE